MKSTNRQTISFAAMLLLCAIPAAAQNEARTWAHVRAAGLYGHTVQLEETRRGTTSLLLGVDPATDGLWLPLPAGVEASSLRIEPELPAEPDVSVVEVPAQLSSTWAIVPLPLSAWGITSLDGLSSIHISRGQHGNLRASSISETKEQESVCAPERRRPPAMTFPARVADFEAGPVEPLGNRFGFFAGRGATVNGVRVRDAASTRMSITANLDAAGSFGGFWLQLAPSAWLDDPEAGVDARGLASIAIRGRGEPRGVVKVSDVSSAKKDDSAVIGTLEGAADADGSWLRVLPVPAGKLDLSRLRSLVVDLTPVHGGRVDIDEIDFLGAGETAPPLFEPAAATTSPSNPRAGIWVWNTDELFAPDSEWRERLLDTITRWKLTEVYLQIPHADGDATLAVWSDAQRSAALADLIGVIHRAGVQVHALDGAAWLALPEERADLVALAASVHDYNAAHPAATRFDALHLDIEPYLLPAFGGRRRPELLSGLLDSLTTTKKTIGAMPLWLDIPFWYDSKDETTVETGPRAGCAKSDFLQSLFTIADGIGVMSYRTRADGADGLASIALGELAIARDRNKPVLLGIETIRLPVEEGWDAELAGGGARAGDAVAAIPPVQPAYVLFSPSASASELRWLRKNRYRVLAAVPSDSALPSKITFYGRSADDIRGVVSEALELARRSGTPADGVAYHELRTMP